MEKPKVKWAIEFVFAESTVYATKPDGSGRTRSHKEAYLFDDAKTANAARLTQLEEAKNHGLKYASLEEVPDFNEFKAREDTW